MLKGNPGKTTGITRKDLGERWGSRPRRERREMGKGMNGFLLSTRTKILWLLSDLKIKSDHLPFTK